MLFHHSLRASACLFALVQSASLLAAEDTTNTGFAVGEDIVVTARNMAGSTANVITSVDTLGPDVAQNANVNYAWELVGRLPGVLVTNFNQGSTSGKFAFRGFNGEGEINAVKLLIDGVPSNVASGNMFYIDQVFPIDIAGIELVRGTSDPRYGLHNIAGNANILTRIGGTYVDAKASTGSYASHEGQLSAGLERGGFSQNYLVAYRETNGFRDHADLDRLSLAGKWFYSFSDDIRLGLIARHYISHAEEPGYLTFVDSRRDRRATNAFNATDGDQRKLQQASLHFDAAVSDDFDMTAKAYFNRTRDDRYVKFSAAAAQQRRVTNEDHWGALAAAHYHARLGAMDLMIEIGGDVQVQDNESLRFTAINRVPTAQTRDQKMDLTVGGVYLQASLKPADWITITPAYRLDWVSGDYRNRLNNSSARANDYGTIKQPKISVALEPVEGVTLYGNWGKTFQIGTESGAYLIAPRLVDLNPSINTGWEAGVKMARGPVEGRVALWKQSATGEIKRKLNDPLGDFDNLGATRRKGIDLQLSAKPVSGLSFWGAVAWQKATITEPDPATPLLRGNEIDHVPHWLFSGGVDFTAVERLRLSVWGGGQSDYELTTANNRGRWGDYMTINAEAAYQVSKSVELSVSAKNLTDDYSEYVWWDGAQSLHSPADGTNVTASVRVKL